MKAEVDMERARAASRLCKPAKTPFENLLSGTVPVWWVVEIALFETAKPAACRSRPGVGKALIVGCRAVADGDPTPHSFQ